MNTRICDCRLPIFDFKSICVRLFFLTVILAFSALGSFSQTPEETPPPNANNFHQWGAVTLFSGLPSDNVRSIAQTPDGILWFGTDSGLARFDGRRVQIVPLEGLETSKILSLKTGVGNEIWIGTDGGATRLENGTFYPIPETSGKPIIAFLIGEITTLVSPGNLFFAHHNPDNSLKVVSASRDMQFAAIEQNYDGSRIFGSNGRGLIIEADNELQEVISRPRPFFINALKRDKNGGLWIGARSDRGTGGGLFYAKDIFRPVRVGENVGTVTSIESTVNGDLWIGTDGNGLFHFRGLQEFENLTFENSAGGLRSNVIHAVFVDREGVLWLGTNRGACRFDVSSPFNQRISEDANANFVRTIYRTNDGQFFAGTNRGLYQFADGVWAEIENFPLKAVYSIHENSAGQLLIGTANGLYDLGGKQIMSGDIRAIVDFRGKSYAAVFGRGIVEIESQNLAFANTSPTTLFADNEKLWIGTAQTGVFTFDGREAKPEPAFEILRGAAIRKITKDANNDLWLSGERGLFRYANNELQPIIENQDVRDFAIENSDIWATTLKGGLFHLRFDEIFGWISSDINVEQGLPSEQIFSILPFENRLFIGTNRGVVNYVPSAVAPQIVATRILSQRLHNTNELSGKINLDYPQNSLLVEVAGLSSRTFPEQFQYSFLLKNSKGEIIDKKLSSEAQFSPTNLTAGDYTIEARSFNKDLLVSDPLIVNFSIARAPFPWVAAALGILLTIAIAALIWAIVERRRISQKNRELAAARFDLANEAERERKRIAQDLHDQTLADLRNLMLMSDKLPVETVEFRSEIESVSTEIRRICEDLSPSVLENVGLIAALEFLLSHTIENYKFSAAEQLEETLNFPPNVQMQIYRIAQEVLNNIKRHSEAKSVEMRIKNSSENEFLLSIEDDGTFFNPDEAITKNRGINNIKSRVSLIKAESSWQESENGGTIFQLRKKI